MRLNTHIWSQQQCQRSSAHGQQCLRNAVLPEPRSKGLKQPPRVTSPTVSQSSPNSFSNTHLLLHATADCNVQQASKLQSATAGCNEQQQTALHPVHLLTAALTTRLNHKHTKRYHTSSEERTKPQQRLYYSYYSECASLCTQTPLIAKAFDVGSLHIGCTTRVHTHTQIASRSQSSGVQAGTQLHHSQAGVSPNKNRNRPALKPATLCFWSRH